VFYAQKPFPSWEEKFPLFDFSALPTFSFEAGAILSSAKTPLNHALWIKCGRVDIYSRHMHTNARDTIAKASVGDFIGAEILLSEHVLPVDAVAATAVNGYIISNQELEKIQQQEATFALAIIQEIAKQKSAMLNKITKEYQLSALNSPLHIDVEDHIQHATIALNSVSTHANTDIDRTITQIVHLARRKLDYFAEEETFQTGMGSTESKKDHLKYVCEHALQELLNVHAFGRLNRSGSPVSEIAPSSAAETIYEYGEPIGIVFSIAPLTNAIADSLSKILNCIKTRNSLILSYPHNARDLGESFITLVQEILEQNGLPKNLIQIVSRTTDNEHIKSFISHERIGLVISNGDTNAIDHSEEACYDIGPNNTPAWITHSATISHAAEQILKNKSYDNGMVRGSENSIVADADIIGSLTGTLTTLGAAIITSDERRHAINTWFDTQKWTIKPEFIGRSARFLAKKANIDRPHDITLIVLPALEEDIPILAREKLAPIVTLFKARNIGANKTNGLELSTKILAAEGMCHTAVIYSNNAKQIDIFAQKIPANRMFVNQSAAVKIPYALNKASSSFTKSRKAHEPSITQGIFTWRDLLNIKRLVFYRNDALLSRHPYRD